MGAGLVWSGRVTELTPIMGADRIVAATVVCGEGGKWHGVVPKDDFAPDAACLVYLPDSVVPATDEFAFMQRYHYRVRMQRLRGVPSEVLITKIAGEFPCGTDLTHECGVTKFEKPVDAKMAGIAKGNFPTFIPKTDEPNFQRAGEMLSILDGRYCYVTEKADGSSCTIYRRAGVFGVCSRNMDLVEQESNAYWAVAKRYKLHESLPEGFAVQGELVGPGVQKNPLGLVNLDLLVFSVFDIGTQTYLDYGAMMHFCGRLGLTTVKVLQTNAVIPMDANSLQELANGHYANNGTFREGVVIRPMYELRTRHDERVSVKVINLNYRD